MEWASLGMVSASVYSLHPSRAFHSRSHRLATESASAAAPVRRPPMSVARAQAPEGARLRRLCSGNRFQRPRNGTETESPSVPQSPRTPHHLAPSRACTRASLNRDGALKLLVHRGPVVVVRTRLGHG